MYITLWTITVLTLFKPEYPYNSNITRHFSFNNNNITTCIHKNDKPFKKGSKTFPRAELRQIEEYNTSITVEVNISNITVTNGFDYSIWQIFGKKPFLMFRYRNKQKQMVVFEGSPKIQEIQQFPTKCYIDCNKKQISCEDKKATFNNNCEKLHLKLGIYSQQMNPSTTECITYNNITITNK